MGKLLLKQDEMILLKNSEAVLMGKAHGLENWQSMFVSKDAICVVAIVILCGPMNRIAHMKRKPRKRF